MIIAQDRIIFNSRYHVAGAKLTWLWDITGESPREIFDYETNKKSIVFDRDIRLATKEERFENEEYKFGRKKA
jgi:hypothetical protein